MDIDKIKSLDVSGIADKNCMLFLWATFPNLPEALSVINAWGFIYKTLGFCWIKISKDGSPRRDGMGYYTKSNCEVCLIGVKGKALVINHSVPSTITTPKTRHSEKPGIVRDKILQLCGDVPRIELFARQQVAGWDSWGLESQ